mgnify:CR=1 FL=1
MIVFFFILLLIWYNINEIFIGVVFVERLDKIISNQTGYSRKDVKELVKNKTCIIISNRISDVKDANNNNDSETFEYVITDKEVPTVTVNPDGGDAKAGDPVKIIGKDNALREGSVKSEKTTNRSK